MILQKTGLSMAAAAALVLSTGCASTGDHNGPAELAATRMHCGQTVIDLDYTPSTGLLALTHGGKQILMTPRESASGARFVASGDARTVFWSKGETATLSLSGEALPRSAWHPAPSNRPSLPRATNPSGTSAWWATN